MVSREEIPPERSFRLRRCSRASAPVHLGVRFFEVILDLLAHLTDFHIELALGLRDRITRQHSADGLDLSEDFLPKTRDLVGQAVLFGIFVFFLIHVWIPSPILGDFARVVRNGAKCESGFWIWDLGFGIWNRNGH